MLAGLLETNQNVWNTNFVWKNILEKLKVKTETYILKKVT